MKIDFLLKNLSYERIIHYSIIFLLAAILGFLIFDIYVFYLYFYGFTSPPEERIATSLSDTDYERAIKAINDREKFFNDIAKSNSISINPFR